jgi:uncharacterized protein (DUF433 family)
MTLSSQNKLTGIIRTERGLTISGTRITLYDVMDYLKSQYPAKFIRSLFDLTEEQISTALAYIEQNRDAVEAEYELVLQQAEENRKYWEERNQNRLKQIREHQPKPGQEALWEKLQQQKAKHAAEA